MSFLDAVRSILGIKPVKVGDLAAAIAPTLPSRHVVNQGIPSGETSDIADFQVIPEYEQVRALLEAKVPLVFVYGGAGTGKSVLINYLRKALLRRIAVLAPTGIAALNVGGATVHSFFHFPPRIIQPEDAKEAYDRTLYTKLQVLVIDEVSMLRPDLLDGVDCFLRLNRDSDAPFGGVQVLLVGDLLQLPPVVERGEERVLRGMGYLTNHFFSAKGLEECEMVPVFLGHVFRQVNPAFAELLSWLREGKRIGEALRAINERCFGDAHAADGELVLTCTNRNADERNRRRLSGLSSAARVYQGITTGRFRIESTRLPSPANLELKAGAQVMFTKNDANKRWVNGTIGRVLELGQRDVKVEIKHGRVPEVVHVEPVSWEQYGGYEYDPSKDRIVPKLIGRYTQLPLMLAWAVTIHKAQGKTLGKVFVDFGDRAFATGQVYVALSRVQSLDDLRLARPVRKDDVKCDSDGIKFYRQLAAMTRIGR